MFDGVLNAFLLSKNFEDNMTILYGCLILEENMINTLRFSRNLGSRSETFDSWNDSKIRETKNTFTIFRSSRPEVFCKKGVLRNFAKFTGTDKFCNWAAALIRWPRLFRFNCKTVGRVLEGSVYLRQRIQEWAK